MKNLWYYQMKKEKKTVQILTQILWINLQILLREEEMMMKIKEKGI